MLKRALYFIIIFTIMISSALTYYRYFYNPFVYDSREGLDIYFKRATRWSTKTPYITVKDKRTKRLLYPWPGVPMTKIDSNIFRFTISPNLDDPEIIFSYERRDLGRVHLPFNKSSCYLDEYKMWVPNKECKLEDLPPIVQSNLPTGIYHKKKLQLVLTTNPNDYAYYTLDGTDPHFSSTRRIFTGKIRVEIALADNFSSVVRLYTKNSFGEKNVSYDYRYAENLSCVEEPDINIPKSLGEDRKLLFQKLRIYQIFLPTFIDANPQIGYRYGLAPGPVGGDLRGAISALPYIKSLGVNAIWLSPIFDSADREGGYQIINSSGYHPKYFFRVDPKFGSDEDLKTFISNAHALGLYVFFDGIVHHHKPDTELPASPCGEVIPNGHYLDHPYPESIEYFKEMLMYWIDKYEVDGWRFDKAYPLLPSYWKELRESVEKISLKRKLEGKKWGTLGYVVIESFEGDPQDIKDQAYGNNQSPALYAAFDFPLRYSLVQILATGEEHTRTDTRRASALIFNTRYGLDGHSIYGKDAVPNLMIGNHDLVRFGDLIQRAGYGDYWKRHKLALSFQASYTGSITTYYGEEIGLEVPNFSKEVSDPHCRSGFCDLVVSRSMMTIDPSKLDKDQLDLLSFYRKLMKTREKYPALYAGKRDNIFLNDHLLIDLKKHKQNILIVFNMGTEAINFELPMRKIHGTKLTPLLNSSSPIHGERMNFKLSLPPFTNEFYLVD